MPDKPTVYVHLLPMLIPPGALRGATAIVIDVLRATTVMVHALAAGCEAIIPCREIVEARAVAESLGPGRAILAGERQGVPIEGFDLGNSPSSFTPEVCRGRTVVMTTTNGTKAILASLEAKQVLVAGFVNFGATCTAAMASGQPIHIVCAGTDGEVSLEDTLLAGRFVEIGRDYPIEIGNDAARIAASLAYAKIPAGSSAAAKAWSAGSASQREERLKAVYSDMIATAIRSGRGGRRNLELGLEADILDSARLDRFDLVAELRRDPVRIVRA